MVNESNENKVGYASWYYTQSFRDYKDFMSFEEYQQEICRKCIKRLDSLSLQEGDKVRVEIVGGWKIRRYTGEVIRCGGGTLTLQQTKRTVSFQYYSIDEVEILERANKKRVRKGVMSGYFGGFIH